MVEIGIRPATLAVWVVVASAAVALGLAGGAPSTRIAAGPAAPMRADTPLRSHPSWLAPRPWKIVPPRPPPAPRHPSVASPAGPVSASPAAPAPAPVVTATG